MNFAVLQKIAFVQAYIHHLKDKEVDIAVPTSGRQLDLLEIAYASAVEYFGHDMRNYK